MTWKCRLVDVAPGTREWHDWRAQGIGGSDMPTILNLSPYEDATLNRLARQKLGLEKPTEFLNWPARRGQLLEPKARKLLSDRLALPIYVGCVEHLEYPHFRASLDGYFRYGLSDALRIVEIKALKHEIHQQFGLVVEKKAPVHSLPLHLLVQAQWQLFVSGAECCLFCCYSEKVGEEQPLHVVRLYPEPVLWGGWLIPPAQRFWDDITHLRDHPDDLDMVFPEAEFHR